MPKNSRILKLQWRHPTLSTSLIQGRDPRALYRDAECAREVWDEVSTVRSNVQTRDSKPSNLSQITSSIQLLQAEVQHGFYLMRWRLLQIGRLQEDSNHPSLSQSNLVQALWHKSIVVEVHLEYLQLNGEINMLEKPEKKYVNSFEIHFQQLMINGQLVRPEPPSDDAPSTACDSSSVSASGGVSLGKAKPPCFGLPPGSSQVLSRRLPPPPPPPSSGCTSDPATNAAFYPRQWTPLNTRPKSCPPDGSGNGGSGSGGEDPNTPAGNAHPSGGGPGSNASGGGMPPGEGPPNGNPGSGSSNPGKQKAMFHLHLQSKLHLKKGISRLLKKRRNLFAQQQWWCMDHLQRCLILAIASQQLVLQFSKAVSGQKPSNKKKSQGI